MNKRTLVAVLAIGAIILFKVIKSIILKKKSLKKTIFKFIERYLEEPKSIQEEEESKD